MKTYIVILTTGARYCITNCQVHSGSSSVAFFREVGVSKVIIAEFFTPALAGYYEI